jgi:ribonucleoside-diphosphate reductase alpha chain
MGGGIGYDFSTLRPRGALIKRLGSRSTGPIAFMHIYNGLGDCTASVGGRRGAQMGIIRIDHPDIMEFVRAKNNATELQRFNMSVAVTDEFMEKLEQGKPFELRFGGKVYDVVEPEELWDNIMQSTWDWGEPGVFFVDTVNRMNNLWYCEKIAATNPCGEQPLPPFGACLLGSFNLPAYLRQEMGQRSTYSTLDFEQLAEDIPVVVACMDRVVDVANYPLPEQCTEALNKRRMGLGVMGLANAIEVEHGRACYGEASFVRRTEQVLTWLRDHAYQASMVRARTEGSFPLFQPQNYCSGEFIQTLPPELRKDIRRHGIRNSHLLSMAPTGTISQCADNVSSGIEPVFSHSMSRKVIMDEGPVDVLLRDYAVDRYGLAGKRSHEVTPGEHVDVLLAAARLVDSAVSKTCNVSPQTPMDDFKQLYRRAWLGGAKGCTTYQSGSKRGAVIVSQDAAEGASCTIDPTTGQRECA